jgi:hypothetical protein
MPLTPSSIRIRGRWCRSQFVFAHAEWSVGAASAPGYPAELVDLYRPHTVETRLLPEADHAATIMTHSGATVVAEMIKDALSAG